MEHASLPTGELVRLAELDAQVSENQDVTIHENGAGQAWDESRERQRSVWRRGRKLGSGGFGTVYREDCVAGELSGAVRAVKCIALNTNTHGKRSVDYGRELKAVAKFSQKQVSEQCDIDVLFRGKLSTHQSFCSTPTPSSSPMDRLLLAAGKFIRGSHHGERWRGDRLSVWELTSGEMVWQHEGDYAAVALSPEGVQL
jgi:hypothetical protein